MSGTRGQVIHYAPLATGKQSVCGVKNGFSISPIPSQVTCEACYKKHLKNVAEQFEKFVKPNLKNKAE